MKQGLVVALGALLTVTALPATARAQQASRSEPGEPRTSTDTLRERPRVHIDDADGASHGRASDTKRATRLQPGAYTFLSSTPGSYARVTRLTDRFSYVEHLERGQQYVTFGGGLRVALGK